MRLFGPPAVIVEKQEIVRKRTFNVRSMDEVTEVLATLKREKFTGCVKFNVSPGGVTTSVETEERSRL